MSKLQLSDYISSLLGIKDKKLNQSLLQEAFTHKSYSTEQSKPTPQNQRLEFLGDSVLGLIISHQLYLDHPDFDESKLTLRKISLVREETLFEAAKSIELDIYIIIGKGEDRKGGRDNPAILGDAMEALIGYVYLDLGFDMAKKLILDHIYPKKHTMILAGSKSFKSLLQEKLQSDYKQLPIYIDEEVHRDDKINMVQYKSTIMLNNKIIGVGYGTNKKKAQEDAAKNSL